MYAAHTLQFCGHTVPTILVDYHASFWYRNPHNSLTPTQSLHCHRYSWMVLMTTITICTFAMGQTGDILYFSYRRTCLWELSVLTYMGQHNWGPSVLTNGTTCLAGHSVITWYLLWDNLSGGHSVLTMGQPDLVLVSSPLAGDNRTWWQRHHSNTSRLTLPTSHSRIPCSTGHTRLTSRGSTRGHLVEDKNNNDI